MIWYLTNVERYQAETEAIAALATTAPWLSGLDWRLGDGVRLLCDADIMVRGRRYPVTLRYNAGFPHTPPSVLPRVQERWSTHQYGNAGELCLEFGPDNWVSSLTGADMLASAFRLLEGETPEDIALGLAPKAVPSRHALTLGQSLRNSTQRIFYTSAFEKEIENLNDITTVSFRYRIQEQELVMWPVSLTYSDNRVWNDPLIPKPLSAETAEWIGMLVPRPIGFSVNNFKTPSELQHALLGVPTEEKDAHQFNIIVLADENQIEAFLLSHESGNINAFSMIPPSPSDRVYSDYAVLNEKKVGLIGCGSVGSKIAAMLTRAGVTSFVLVDDDIFQPENLVRNELDWWAVGDHKVDALSKHLKLIRSDIQIDARRQNLGGQEASGTLHGTMTALSTCDLFIDATALGIAFNYVAALSVQNEKPMVWVEVFAGGIGGIVSRSRKGLEPDPQLARSRILQWCEDQNCPVPFTSVGGYEDNSTPVPHIADDADVSVMAAHAARISIDTLIERTPSYFPYSAYAIGLREGWIFTQPFDTAPIDLGPPTSSTITSVNEDKSREGALGISALIERFRRDKSANTS